MRRSWFWMLVASVSLLPACRDAGAPGDALRPDSPRLALVEGAPLVLGVFELPNLGGNSWGQAPQPIPIELPATGRYKLRIRVDGFIQFAQNTCLDNSGGPTQVGPGGYRFDNGVLSWDVYFRVYNEQDDFYYPVSPRVFSADGSSVTYEIKLDRPGLLLWGRPELTYCYAPGPVNPNVSGSQTATITLIPFVEQQFPQAELTLVCNDRPASLQIPVSITRGSEVACTVGSTNSALPLQEVRWSYRDEKNHLISKHPDEGSANSWGGIMVAGGQIRVAANVGGVDIEISSTVSVAPRAWRDVLPPAVEDRSSPTCAERTPRCLPHTIVQWQDIGKTMFAESGPAPWARAISSGPNRDWAYFAGDGEGTYKLPHPITKLHPEIFDARSDFYRSRQGRFCQPEAVLSG